ncbi:25646_t:CDS:1, partial [Gigaspora rosea]
WAGEYYKKNKIKRKRTQKKKLEDNIGQLIQKIMLNYAYLTSKFAVQKTQILDFLTSLGLIPVPKAKKHKGITTAVNTNTLYKIVHLKEITVLNILIILKIEESLWHELMLITIYLTRNRYMLGYETVTSFIIPTAMFTY